MAKTKKTTILVEKTDQLNQKKLLRIARRYGVSPMSLRELQLGYSEELPCAAANRLIKDGYVKCVKSKPRSSQQRVDSLTTEYVETGVTSDDVEVKVIAPIEGVTSDPKEEKEQI